MADLLSAAEQEDMVVTTEKQGGRVSIYSWTKQVGLPNLGKNNLYRDQSQAVYMAGELQWTFSHIHYQHPLVN